MSAACFSSWTAKWFKNILHQGAKGFCAFNNSFLSYLSFIESFNKSSWYKPPPLFEPRDQESRQLIYKLAQKYNIRIYRLIFNHSHMHTRSIPWGRAYKILLRYMHKNEMKSGCLQSHKALLALKKSGDSLKQASWQLGLFSLGVSLRCFT